VKKIARALCAPLLLAALSASAKPEPVATVPAQEVAALRSAVGTHRLLLLGEMHGTREAPAFASRLVADYAAEGPALLVLEIWQHEQAAIDRYLASDGDAAARAQLLSGPFWQVPLAKNDGRRNGAAVALLEDMRRLRHAGRDVQVLAMDPGDVGGSQARDEAMAGFLRSAYGKMDKGRMIVLTGNVHAMRRKPGFAPPEMQDPMGSRLADLDLYSVDLGAAKGESWGCPNWVCGPMKVQAHVQESGVQLGQPWDYEVLLPEYSIPAMMSEGKLQP
jgi:erythromycin esterase-like protein